MAKAVRAVGDAATNAHRAMKELAHPVGTFMVDAFQLLALFVIGDALAKEVMRGEYPALWATFTN